jgi:hypothetical protein
MVRILGLYGNPTLWKCLEIGQDPLNCISLKCSSLGNILNLLIAEVAYAISNLPKTITQMYQPIIDLYLAKSSSVHRSESSTPGWHP